METRTPLKTSGIYGGPTSTSAFSFGGREVKVVRPADPDRLLDDPAVRALNRQDDYMPYWAYLWPGAFLLAEAVGREPWAEGTKALEIGCGLGLAGLVGVGRGLHVNFTDYDEDSLGFVARSVEANGFDPSHCTTERLDWRELPETQYPVILGADVLYEHRLVPLVADLLAKMLAPDGFALVAGPYRVATEGIAQALNARGLVCEDSSIETDAEMGHVRGTLHRIRRKPA
ncbi:class I SAM-dependent methyltransferase [Singulisphaera sp. PoT]|uniref:class I SAM-dependent methyltransferase n=1 Tax=Singulisphaera sp. PoT TaxID=3411797 RepID=UPI003BF4612F